MPHTVDGGNRAPPSTVTPRSVGTQGGARFPTVVRLDG